MNAIHPLSPETFAAAALGPQPVVVEFTTDWCGMSHILAPMIQEMADAFTAIHFYRVNMDAYPELAGEYGVRRIPTLLFFKNGHPVDAIVGAVSKKTLLTALSRLISNGKDDS